QLKDTVDALQYSGNFAEIDSFETLMRHWHVKGMSVRPVHRMVAHSAFIIIARRLAASAVSALTMDSQPAAVVMEPSAAASASAARTCDVDPLAVSSEELAGQLDEDVPGSDRD
ncbi:MAG TPA: hypothetical protein VHY56_05835, partial [Candidatus Binataceae bacterium]|nr:hypothetical protein [Candidatus Binataceae bacterium]